MARRNAAAAAHARSARAVRTPLRRRRLPLSPKRARRRESYRSSVLDFVSADAKRLAKDLGPTDQRKLDEYLSSDARDRIADGARRQRQHHNRPRASINRTAIPADFAEHFSLMTNMLTVAFQSNLTRVATFLVTREGTSRAYREIGIPTAITRSRIIAASRI